MPDDSHLPIRDPGEIEAFLRDLPIAVHPDFAGFALGFPRRYLASTPRAEIVKHYALARSLGSKVVISSLAREGRLWKLSLLARDRRHLFSRIAGALSGFGANIVRAEAFANANALVLDTFRFEDREGSFEADGQRRRFQVFLEDAVEGKADPEPLLRERIARARIPPGETLDAELQNDEHLPVTRLTLSCRDHFGLLYLVGRLLSEEGCNIEMAYIETPGDRVRDEFYLTRDGVPLAPDTHGHLKEKLTHLGERYFGQDPALLPGRT